MDLRVLCVFVAMAYVDVSARITCNFQPKSWRSAMIHCLNLGGNPVGISNVLTLPGLHMNGSFWTADYASRIATTDSPVECEYRTLSSFNPSSLSKLGNCEVIRNYICCDNIITSGRLQSLDRCGMLDFNGNFQFVSDCVTLRYSFCEVENYTGSDLSVCGSTMVTKQPSSNNPSTFVSQNTETLTATMMSINEKSTTESIFRNNASSSSDFKTVTTVQDKTETSSATRVSINEITTTESIVRYHDSSSSASVLGIGLGASIGIVVIVIIAIVGVCVYKRRNRNANCEGSRNKSGRTELGEIHVYDEISNHEESAYAASKVDIYDTIRTDGEQEHAYESVTTSPKY